MITRTFALLFQHPRPKGGSPSINTAFVIIGVHKGFVFGVVIRLGLHWFRFKGVRVTGRGDGFDYRAEAFRYLFTWGKL